jgi:predicted trehalose synthase
VTQTLNLDVLSGARWFAGKGRVPTSLAVADRYVPPGADGAAVELVDVGYADGGVERYALPLRDGVECALDDPLWAALARAAMGEALDGSKPLRGSRRLAEDISNTAVVLGEQVVLKLYRRPEPGPHPEAQLLEALEGSPHAPRLLGAVAHGGTTLLVAQELVPGEQVGWERLIARLAAADTGGDEPAELARVTARLHRRLAERLGAGEAEPSPVPRIRLPRELAHLTEQVAAGLEPLSAHPLRVQRIHGDLHVAQFVRGERLVVVDWEGEPGLSLAERSSPRPALRDLASLRLSLAHAARAAHRRAPGFDWQAWSTAARQRALAAYIGEAGPVDEALLHALELEKELAELDYAERWLPEWLYVPLAVLPFVLDEAA